MTVMQLLDDAVYIYQVQCIIFQKVELSFQKENLIRFIMKKLAFILDSSLPNMQS